MQRFQQSFGIYCSKIVFSCHARNYFTLNQRLDRRHYPHQHNTNNGTYIRHHRGNDFLVPFNPRGLTIPPNRGYGMVVVRILREALKLRYLLLGGAIYGGITLKKKYEGWKKSFPDLKWLKVALHPGEMWSQFSKSLIKVGGAVKDVTKIDWKNGLPDLKWLQEALHPGEMWSQFSKSLIKVGSAVKDVTKIAYTDPRLKQLGKKKLGEWRQWFNGSGDAVEGTHYEGTNKIESKDDIKSKTK